MKKLSCAVIRRRLSAFCDGELSLNGQVAIEAHLKGCDACMAEAGVIREVGETLRATSAAAMEGCAEHLPALQAAVVPRIKAERATSMARRVEDLFEDMHLVWATGSGVIAGVICGLLVFGMVHVAKAHPNSLAVLLDTLAHEPAVPEPLVLPRVYADAIMPATVMNQQSREDAVFALAAVVMQDGSLSEIRVLEPEIPAKGATTRSQARLAFDLLDAVSTARFEPARVAGAPVSVNVVWVLTHTTVRGKLPGIRTKEGPANPI